MEAIWNCMRLERPPNAICHIERQKFDTTKFCITLDKVITDLTSQELLHKEAAILSRLIYRMKSKFRNDKGVKSMSRVNKALLKYLSLSLEKEYKNLKDYVEIDEEYVTLPSKQMIEYVLIKTQGFAKLMLRVEEVSKYCAYFLKCRINLGHAWSIAIIAFAVVSRIWILSRYLVKTSCTWYNDLYQYLKLLEDSGVPWLPVNYELTSDLKSWLTVPWIDKPTPRVPSNYGLKNTMFKLITPREPDSDEDLFFDIQDYNKGTKGENRVSFLKRERTVYSPVASVESKNIVPSDDTGEVIDRRAFNLKRSRNTPIDDKAKHTKFDEERKKKETSIDDNNWKRLSENMEDESASSKNVKQTAIKYKNLTKKGISKKLLAFDDAKNKSDLMILLNKESYPGLDKLRWNMIRNKTKKLLDKLENRSDKTNEEVLFETILKRIKSWIT